jgi:hypothetical protein
MTRAHPFFGVLTSNADGAAEWESTADLAGHEVRLELRLEALEEEVANGVLDTFAALYGQLPQLDREARAAIAKERSDPESATATYVDFVRDNLEDAADADVVAGLVPVRLWAWFDAPRAPEVMLDYSFAPERMDHVLCASFDRDARLTALEVES